jgi:SAM-dependent methyltransferase
MGSLVPSSEIAGACLVCRNGQLKPYSGETWEFGNISYGLLRCPACNCAFTNPLPDNQSLKTYYEKVFNYRWYADHYGAKLRDARSRLAEYRDLLGNRMLDFGGGLGYLSKVAREAGLDSVTFDPYTAKKVPQPGVWDSVVSLHALEHSNDPDTTIELMKSMLRPGGSLILAVPNFGGRGYREQGMKWVWAQPPLIHIFHFTAEGLRALLIRHGFENIRVSYHERWDANLISDLENVDKFRRMDSDWGRRRYNFPLIRKLIAFRNARARFKCLEKAEAQQFNGLEDCSELQIVATAL